MSPHRLPTRWLRLLSVAWTLAWLAGPGDAPAQALTFTVTTSADSGPGSLRQAILDANAAPGPDTITFLIGAAGSPQTIALASALPAISGPVLLDGWSQGGAGYAGPPLIEINGGALADWNTVTGLQVTAGASTVRGLAINYFNIAVSLESAGGNVLAGNYLGLALDGVTAVGNRTGVRIAAASDGNRLGTDGDGVNDAAERNIISAAGLVQQNNSSGLLIDSGSDNNWIAGNYIGTDASGTLDRGNASNGITTAGLTIIGTDGDGVNDDVEGNLISGNDGHGIALATTASGSRVAGNRIGTDISGTAALPNDGHGVSVGPCSGGCSNLIIGVNGDGVSDALEGNLISGNGGSGVFIPAGTFTNNVVAGNRIGVNAAGAAALPNDDTGVHLGGDLSRLGTNGDGISDALEGNLISGNGDGAGNNNHGVVVPSGADGHILAGNRIGTDAAGLSAIPNGQNGVQVSGNSHALSGNLIAGNGGNGLSLSDAFSATVTGNLIGVAVDGATPLGNGGHGVSIGLNSDGNVIGGADAGQGNVIAYNAGDGVFVDSNCGAAYCLRNAIVGNRLFENGGLGIDLAPNGATPNDATDADAGPNTLQNFPVLTAVDNTGGLTTVTGTLTSAAATTFTLNFFASPACDPSGHGEGETYLGQAAVATGADGVAAFGITLAASVPYSYSVTATAAGPAGDTSEFSACLPALGNQPVAGLQVASDSPTFLGLTTRFTATVSAGSGVAFTWGFGDGAGAGGATATHVYSATGTYTATVTAANALNTLTATTTVDILPPPACAATPDDGATVFTSADAAAVQQAVNAAPAGGTVKVAGVCAGVAQTNGLTQSLFINEPLTLLGGYSYADWGTSSPALYPTTLDAQGLGRVVFITSTVPVTIENVSLQNGLAGGAAANCPAEGCGGGLYTNGPLILRGVEFRDNTAARAGGAYVLGILEAFDTTWRNNQCTQLSGGGFEAYGATRLTGGLMEGNACSYAGGLFVDAALTISGTQFISNTATSPVSGSGGAVYASGPLTILDARFERNTAQTGAGAVLHTGASNDALTITATQFISNTALNEAAQGGALYTSAPSALIHTSAFQGNAVPGVNANGGAIVAFNAITLTQVSLISNTAGSQGGGLYHWGLNEPGDTGQTYPLVISDSVLAGNTAGDEGGGLYFRRGFAAENVPITIADTDFDGNTAATGGGAYLTQPAVIAAGQFQENQAVIGGGLYVTTTATLSGTYFISNTADYIGGGLFLSGHPLALTDTVWVGNATPWYGGAVYAEAGRLEIIRSAFDDNQANVGGAVYAAYSPDPEDTLTVVDSAFRGNAGGEAGSPFTGSAGALFSPWPTTITRTTFEANTSTGSGGAAMILAPVTLVDTVFTGNMAQAQGGGLYLRTGPGLISGAVFSGNQAEAGGGLLVDTAITDATTLVITASQFVSNTAGLGGGLWVYNMPVDLENTAILSNTAATDGGGLVVYFEPAAVRGSTLAGNQAGRYGGGLQVYHAGLTLTDNTLASNTAAGQGGGLWITGTAPALIDMTRLIGNASAGGGTSGGGGAVWAGAPLTIHRSQFLSNTAALAYGGALETSDPLTVTASSFFDNEAGLGGGALALRGPDPRESQIVNSVLADNDAGGPGAAIYHAAGGLNLVHATLARSAPGGGTAVEAVSGSLTLVNTIVASHTVGLQSSGTAAITADHTLFFGNGQDLTGTVASQAAVLGDPRFMNPARRDYHLRKGSAAVDAGALAGVGTDLDGYLRYAGRAPDIGADEFGARVLVFPGQWQTLSAPVAPDWTAAASLPPGAVDAATAVDLTPEEPPTRPLPLNAEFAGASFRLDLAPAASPAVFQAASGSALAQPIMLEMAHADLAGPDKNQLNVLWWDDVAGGWRNAAETCSPAGAYQRQPEAGRLAVPVCAAGEYTLVSEPFYLFLPILER